VLPPGFADFFDQNITQKHNRASGLKISQNHDDLRSDLVRDKPPGQFALAGRGLDAVIAMQLACSNILVDLMDQGATDSQGKKLAKNEDDPTQFKSPEYHDAPLFTIRSDPAFRRKVGMEDLSQTDL
jgi:hypothetical protein